jgi:hypothetical protein
MRPPAPRRRSGPAGARDAAAFPDASRATASMREPNDRRRRPRRSLRLPFRDSRRRCARRSRSGGGPVVQCPNGAISRQHSTFRAACIHAAQTLSDTYRPCRAEPAVRAVEKPGSRMAAGDRRATRARRRSGSVTVPDGGCRRRRRSSRTTVSRPIGSRAPPAATTPPGRGRTVRAPRFPTARTWRFGSARRHPRGRSPGRSGKRRRAGSGRAAAMRFPSHLGHRIRTVAGRHRDPACAMPEAVQRPNEDRCRTGRGGRSATVAPAREPARMPPHATSRRDARPADLPAC